MVAEQQPGSNETNFTDVKQPETQPSVTNNDGYLKFTEFLHLNFSHSKQFMGLPITSDNGASLFDPFAAFRQLLPSLPYSQNLNPLTQVQTSSGQFPNVVSRPNPENKPKHRGFNSNYNYNFGKNDLERFGVDLSSHGSPATTGFPGSANLGIKPTIGGESSEKFLPKRPNSGSKFTEQSSDQQITFPQRNITAYWIF